MKRPSTSWTVDRSYPSLTDTFGRELNYLRLAVTDRCNLRCTYCMPAEGVVLSPRAQILDFEEYLRLVGITTEMGVTKVRITGGEPMVRKGILEFLQALKQLPQLKEVHLTSNGFWQPGQCVDIVDLGLAGINLSLDSLIPERFEQITRRDAFDQVYGNLQELLASSIPLKVNMVVQKGINDDEIIPFAQLAQDHPIEIRFIEHMPFNGSEEAIRLVPATEILTTLRKHLPVTKEITHPGSTANVYEVAGFAGRLGIIAGYSRTFCSSCNRLRITSQGQLKTCLYDDRLTDLRATLRDGSSDLAVAEQIAEAISRKARNGQVAEARSAESVNTSMSLIGG